MPNSRVKHSKHVAVFVATAPLVVRSIHGVVARRAGISGTSDLPREPRRSWDVGTNICALKGIPRALVKHAKTQILFRCHGGGDIGRCSASKANGESIVDGG